MFESDWKCGDPDCHESFDWHVDGAAEQIASALDRAGIEPTGLYLAGLQRLVVNVRVAESMLRVRAVLAN